MFWYLVIAGVLVVVDVFGICECWRCVRTIRSDYPAKWERIFLFCWLFFMAGGVAGSGLMFVRIWDALSRVQFSPIDSFVVDEKKTSSAHELNYKYTGAEQLNNVELTVTIRFENGATQEVKRFWASWSPNEEKTISISTSEETPQSNFLEGSAYVNGLYHRIYAGFSRLAEL